MSYLQNFRNITYPYVNADDTFVGRGYHLNVLVDAINGGDNNIEIPFGASTVDINLGPSLCLKAVNLTYAAQYPTDGPSNSDSAGKIVISNGNESAVPRIEWEHDSTRDNTARVTLTPMIIGADLFLRVENLSGHTLKFGLNAKNVSSC